jgi:hypothetical protein
MRETLKNPFFYPNGLPVLPPASAAAPPGGPCIRKGRGGGRGWFVFLCMIVRIAARVRLFVHVQVGIDVGDELSWKKFLEFGTLSRFPKRNFFPALPDRQGRQGRIALRVPTKKISRMDVFFSCNYLTIPFFPPYL